MIRTQLGDITKIDTVQAIVNAANNSLLGGGGVDGYPVDLAAQTAVEAVQKFLAEDPGKIDEVVWVLFDARTERAYENALRERQ